MKPKATANLSAREKGIAQLKYSQTKYFFKVPETSNFTVFSNII